MTGGVTGMGGATHQRDMNGSIPMHVDYSDSEGEDGERPFIGEDQFKPYNEQMKE